VSSQNHGAAPFGSAHHQVVARTHKVINTIVLGSAHLQGVARLPQSYQYNCFLGIGPPQRCCSYSQNQCIRHRRMGPPFRLLLLHTRIIERQLFSSYRGHPRFCRVYSQNHGTEFYGSAHIKLLLVLTKLSIQLFWSIGPPPGVARTHKIMHPTPAADGPFRLLLLHKNNRDNFSSYRGHPVCVYSQNHGAEFYSDRPYQLLLVLKVIKYNCFLSIGPPRCCSYSQKLSNTTVFRYRPTSRCCSYTKSCIRHRRMGPRFRLLLLHTRIIGQLFSSYRATQSLLYSQNHGPNFIRIGPHQVVALAHKVINTTVFGYRPTTQGVARTHKIYQYNCFFGVSFTSRCCSYSQNHGRHHRRMGQHFRLLLQPSTNFFISGTRGFPILRALHKNNGANFIVSAYPESARTHKIMELFFGYRPTAKCCSYSQSYQYNCFGVSAHLQVLLNKNHASDTGGGWARLLLLLHTRIIRDNFSSYQGHPMILRVLTKSWSRILFGSAHHQVVARTHKVYPIQLFLEYRPTSRCCSYSQSYQPVLDRYAPGVA
jgi:hypothetical protein